MEQIKQILQENDIAGFVVIHTPGFSEYLNKLDTSYSAARLENDGIKFRIKSAEIGKEKAKQMATDTVNLFTHLAKQVGHHAMFYLEAEKMLIERYNPEDFPGNETSHTEQNN